MSTIEIGRHIGLNVEFCPGSLVALEFLRQKPQRRHKTEVVKHTWTQIR